MNTDRQRQLPSSSQCDAGADPDLPAAAHAARVAATQGIPLLSVLAWYAGEGRPLRQAPPLRACAEEFLWSKKNAHCGSDTMNEYRSALHRLAVPFGDRQPSALTPQDILDFLRPWKHPVTRFGWFTRLSTFFEWLVLKKYAHTNPIALLTKPPRTGGSGTFFTHAEARELLRRVRHSDQLGFWILSLFAGMRTTEIKRLQTYASPWSLVRLADHVIEIPAGHSKTARRTLRISPLLRTWLQVLKKQRGRFYPPYRTAPQIGLVRRAILREFRGPGVIGAFNLGRRSYISHRLALPRASYAETALFAGNSERMIKKYYRRAVTPADARAYFRLTPASVAPSHV